MNNQNICVLLIIALCVGFVSGFAVHKLRLYPHKLLSKIAHKMGVSGKTHNPWFWSIGIYEGSSPVSVSDSPRVSNPVLTGKSVTDVRAEFVADPFIIRYDNKFGMFFEVFNLETDKGDIGYAESVDGLKWDYKQIVLAEDFHLSYPYVFEWDNNFYMVPETHADLSVRLYKASAFPYKWEYVGPMLEGYHYVDPSILRYQDTWWLFVSSQESDHLNLYYSDKLEDGWQPHPMNPIVKQNKRISRPGGRVILDGDHIYRFAQDDEVEYGKNLYALEITELSTTNYSEHLVSEKPIGQPSGKGWNAAGMHHLDPVKVGDAWIAVVDGRSQ